MQITKGQRYESVNIVISYFQGTNKTRIVHKSEMRTFKIKTYSILGE